MSFVHVPHPTRYAYCQVLPKTHLDMDSNKDTRIAGSAHALKIKKIGHTASKLGTGGDDNQVI